MRKQTSLKRRKSEREIIVSIGLFSGMKAFFIYRKSVPCEARMTPS